MTLNTLLYMTALTAPRRAAVACTTARRVETGVAAASDARRRLEAWLATSLGAGGLAFSGTLKVVWSGLIKVAYTMIKATATRMRQMKATMTLSV